MTGRFPRTAAIAEATTAALLLPLMAKGLRNVHRSTRWLRTPPPDRSDGSTYFYVLVPALREQRVIAALLDRLMRLDYPPDRFEVIVAVDSCERATTAPAATTRAAVEAWVHAREAQHPPVSVVEYTGAQHRRSAQLNEALTVIRRRPRLTGREFIVVFDADSVPDPGMLREVDGLSRDLDQPFAAQSRVTYFANRAQLRNRPLMQASAAYQSLWNHLFEIPRLLATAESLRRGRVPVFPPYCMGHGEVIELPALEAIGGFPAEGPCDGIQLGFALTLAGIPLLPLRSRDDCQVPATLPELVRQHAFWFTGNLQFFRWYGHAGRTHRAAVGLACHAFLSAKWLLRPVAAGAVVVLALRRRQPRVAAAWCLGFVGYYAIARREVAAACPWDAPDLKAAGAGWLVVAAAVKSVGAARAVARAALGLSNANKVER